MLELHNVRMESLSVRKTIRKPLNVTKEPSYVMLESHNLRMESSNVRKKKSKGTTKCEKRIVTCDIGTDVMLELHNVMMEPSTMRKK